MATPIRTDLKTAHHITDGPTTMYAVDANTAVASHPLEWSHTPWDPEKAAAARAKLHEKHSAQAQAEGRDPPPAPVEPEMSDEDRREFAEWRAARDKAAAVLEAARREEAERHAKEAAIAEAHATLSAPAPTPRKPLAGAAKAAAERKAAAEKAAAAHKAKAEREAAQRAKAETDNTADQD